jgi:hypothetical protein
MLDECVDLFAKEHMDDDTDAATITFIGSLLSGIVASMFLV